MTISDSAFDSIRTRVHVAKKEADSAARIAETARKHHDAWDSLLTYANKGWLLHCLDLLGQRSQHFDVGDPETGAALHEITEASRARKDQLRRTMPAELEAACNEAGLPIDADSRHPKYRFRNGFLRLDIDEQRAMAKLANNESELAEFPADVAAIVEVVKRENQRLFGREIDPDKVLKKLRTQYLGVLKKEQKPDGEAVPIRRITHRLGKNEKGFRTDEFLIDLSVLAESGRLTIDGRRLELQQTRKPDQGMLLVGSGGRGYVGFVTFKKEIDNE